MATQDETERRLILRRMDLRVIGVCFLLDEAVPILMVFRHKVSKAGKNVFDESLGLVVCLGKVSYIC